ncbi:MAG: hypothetical protein ACFE9I_18690 [Candidatus Hermodarchaeota archaeon]
MIRALQRAYSNQEHKFLGFRELANKLGVSDDYFTGKLYSPFVKKISDRIVDNIEAKIRWDLQEGDLEYSNYLICERAIDKYRDHKLGRSISFNPPSTPKGEIIEILREAYTKHPLLNPTPGQRINIDILCNNILNNIYHPVDSMNDKNPFSDKEVKFIFKKVREDLIDTFAAEKYNELYEKLCQHNPLSMLRYSNEKWTQYYESTEPKIEAWLNKIPLQSIIDSSKKFNKYYPDFIKIIRTQREILYALWGGRDLLTGELFTDIVSRKRVEQGLPELTGDALYEAALKEIDRHHFTILWIRGNHIEFMKRDCSLPALVPLSKSSHAAIRGAPRVWEQNFKEANEAVFNGKPYIPHWWRSKYQKDFENYLRGEGWFV